MGGLEAEGLMMIIDNDILAKTCKDMIETILLCLENATKGTIYRIGPMPMLRAVRITSGVRDAVSGQIRWGLPEASDYNHTGKIWEEYRDQPGHVREAMAWCVEKQKSWTADNPDEDTRSVRKQLRGEVEDFHHMEPVLVRKADVYGDQSGSLEYPRDYYGNALWQDCDYVVAAVIKIHFKPYTIKRGDRSTKIIKKLSRTLGTELLSLHIRETLSEAQKELARQRLQSCNVLAHELRNTLIKLGFIFSAINAEISYLREQWEAQLEEAFPQIGGKKALIAKLNELIELRLPFLNGAEEVIKVGSELLSQQQQFAVLPLMPNAGEKWLQEKIHPAWKRLLEESHIWDEDKEEIQNLLKRLDRSIWIGLDESLIRQLKHLPDDLKMSWSRIAYLDFTPERMSILAEILELLDHPALSIPHKQQTKKILTSLKALAEMIPEVEERANRIISSLRNGNVTDNV